MQRGYKNRQMKETEESATDAKVEDWGVYFFPKANPPVTITARNWQEAEAKLAALQEPKNT